MVEMSDHESGWLERQEAGKLKILLTVLVDARLIDRCSCSLVSRLLVEEPGTAYRPLLRGHIHTTDVYFSARSGFRPARCLLLTTRQPKARTRKVKDCYRQCHHTAIECHELFSHRSR